MSVVHDAKRKFVSGVVAREVVREAAEILAPHGIVLAPLKGVLFAEILDGPDRARPFSDADVLVGEERFEEAISRLVAAGFALEPEGPNDAERTLRSPTWPLMLDLHARLFPRRTFSLATDGVLGRARRDSAIFGTTVYILAPEDAYAHLVGQLVRDHEDLRAVERMRDLHDLPAHFGLAAEFVAAHLMRHGLARAARYTLVFVDRAFAATGGDAFARDVLAALPRDPLGNVVARAARALVARGPEHALRGSLAARLLGPSLTASVRAQVELAARRARLLARR